VEHPRQLIYEASRVARRVFIEVPLEDTARLPRDFVLDPVGHINFYSMKSIRRLAQSCDLRVTHERITRRLEVLEREEQTLVGALTAGRQMLSQHTARLLGVQAALVELRNLLGEEHGKERLPPRAGGGKGQSPGEGEGEGGEEQCEGGYPEDAIGFEGDEPGSPSS
jgi:hypothetical protein